MMSPNDEDVVEAIDEADAGEADSGSSTRSRRSSRSPSRRGEPMLLEVSWETCNQVGGIYQVIRSKAPAMVDRWGGRYCLVGPYQPQKAAVEFEELSPSGPFGAAIKQLGEVGIKAYYGRWLVTGRPHVVLLDHLSVFNRLHEVKYRLWADHGISTPGDDELLNNCVAFGEALRQFLWFLAQKESERRKLIVHVHEWMAGTSIPALRRDRWPGSIVFTTHATMLGRYLAQNDDYFYRHLPFYDAETEARKYLVEPQFRFERAAAHGAHVFSTVSEVTARECLHLLGRQVDAVVPNGLNIQRFERLHDLQNLHGQFKDQIHRFTMGHFFPSYSFDLDQTLYFFTSGRFEYKNKGMDVTVEALARLNHRLREIQSPVTVVCFLITRRPVRSINVGALEGAAMLGEFRTIADHIKEQIGQRLFEASAAGRIPDLNTIVDEYWLLRLRRTIHSWKRGLPPTIVTHDLHDDTHDPLLNQLRTCRLWNHATDPVKVVYHPDFLTATNPLFGMDYDEFVRGCHLGIFPSYYEPWGYTPLESIAMGVPAVTSDLSGFGSYIRDHFPNHDEHGVWLLNRQNANYWESADQLTQQMFRITQMSRRERINLRNITESFATNFDWSSLANAYHDAHQLALDRL